MRCAGKIIPLIIFINMLALAGWSQSCSTLGQNPFSAFPVCGTNFFSQTSVPACGGKTIPTQCTADGAVYSDVNPYWYKFTCYATGTFGFMITPVNLSDDYDWQLFDITGHDPSEIYTNKFLIVAANWSGSSGPTGASPAGKNPFECASDPATQNISTISTMPMIYVGHDYLLLISHYTSTNQSGYSLSFPTGPQGGTASIVNPVVPTMVSAYGSCNGTSVTIKMNKRVNCSTIATDGSDFTVSGGAFPVSVVSASGNGCTTGFDSDSITLKLNTVLLAGSYTVTSKTGTDGNTLTDNCANNLATGEQISFKFFGANPTPMDSITPPVCITDTLQLVFSRPMNCASIAADGSDFFITGPSTVTVKSASGVCSNGLSSTINVFLTAPIRVNGTFTIHLKNGSDGNSLIDECGFITPTGSSLSFTTKNITTADFQSTVAPGCRYDTIYLSHNGYGGTTQWQWTVDSFLVSIVQNPVLISKSFGPHALQLTVSNGICTDTARSNFIFTDQTVKAGFAVADTLCPTDTLHFTDMSSANTIAWQWNFGNGATSTLQAPGPQSYTLTGRTNKYTTRLVAQNNFNCADTAYKIITVLASCYIAVPTAFTPNGDGLNDYLYPLNAFKADNLEFRVYNRYGQIIFETKDWTKKWDGRVNAQLQPSGTYVWTLDYIDRDTGQHVSLKGTTVLIR